MRSTQNDYGFKKNEYSTTLIGEESKISQKRNELEKIDSDLKNLFKNHYEKMKVIETEGNKKLVDHTTAAMREKQAVIMERDELARKVQDLHDFEKQEDDLEREVAELAEKLRDETGKAEAEKKKYQMEHEAHLADMNEKVSQMEEIGQERHQLEHERRTGTYQLEKKKIENQKTIDQTRKATQNLADKNRGRFEE